MKIRAIAYFVFGILFIVNNTHAMEEKKKQASLVDCSRFRTITHRLIDNYEEKLNSVYKASKYERKNIEDAQKYLAQYKKEINAQTDDITPYVTYKTPLLLSLFCEVGSLLWLLTYKNEQAVCPDRNLISSLGRFAAYNQHIEYLALRNHVPNPLLEDIFLIRNCDDQKKYQYYFNKKIYAVLKKGCKHGLKAIGIINNSSEYNKRCNKILIRACDQKKNLYEISGAIKKEKYDSITAENVSSIFNSLCAVVNGLKKINYNYNNEYKELIYILGKSALYRYYMAHGQEIYKDSPTEADIKIALTISLNIEQD